MVAKRVTALFIATCVILSGIIIPVASQPVAGQSSEPPGIVPNDQKFNVSQNVSVWERSVLTTRAEFSSAETQVPIGLFSGVLGGVGEATVRTDQVGIFGTGDDVTVDFSEDRASSDVVNGTDVELIVARIDTSDDVPATFSEIVDITDPAVANQDATFVQEKEIDYTGGIQTYDIDANSPGEYIVFVTVKEDGAEGYNVDQSGDLSAQTPTTVVGTEQFTVQRAAASADAPTVASPGDDITIPIDSTTAFDDGDSITHVLMVHNDETFSDPGKSQFTIIVPGEVNEDLNLNQDSTLEHTIDETVGTANVDNGTEIKDVNLSDGQVERAVNLGGIVDFVAEDLQGDPARTTAVGETILYASVRATTNEDASPTLNVETSNDWSEGSYRYLYIGSLDSDDTVVSTETGTIEIVEPASTEENPFTQALISDGQTPTDPNNDGKFEDIDGDGTADFNDAVDLAFADRSQLSAQQTIALDFNDDGRVGFDDAVELAFQNT